MSLLFNGTLIYIRKIKQLQYNIVFEIATPFRTKREKQKHVTDIEIVISTCLKVVIPLHVVILT